MKDAELYIEELKNVFGDKDSFQIDELHSFYLRYKDSVPKSTVYWRINSLVKLGVIQRIGRGTYKCGLGNTFVPEITMKIFKTNSFMGSSFPYLKYCIWPVAEINFLSQHLINKRILYVEVERDAVESVFEQLREKFKYVLIGRTNDNAYLNESIIVVRPLVSGSPTQTVRGVPTITIEKLLVDLFSDKEFEFLQGYELTHIFRNAFSKYNVNRNKLFRYASRKDKKNKIVSYIESMN
jgi:hypothetical protein